MPVMHILLKSLSTGGRGLHNHLGNAASEIVIVQPEIGEIWQKASPGRQIPSQLIGVQKDVAQQLHVYEIGNGSLHGSQDNHHHSLTHARTSIIATELKAQQLITITTTSVSVVEYWQSEVRFASCTRAMPTVFMIGCLPGLALDWPDQISMVTI